MVRVVSNNIFSILLIIIRWMIYFFFYCPIFVSVNLDTYLTIMNNKNEAQEIRNEIDWTILTYLI